jgi:hypothetical protein
VIHSASILVLVSLGRFQDGTLAEEAPATGHASEGYTLFAPMSGGTTYLLDAAGAVAHTWESDSAAAGAVALMENGHLLRSARAPRNLDLPGGGQGGLLQELDPEGKLVWSFELAGGQYSLHHDFELTPYGTILAIAWDRKTSAEALAAGRDPAGIRGDAFWPDVVLEILPLPEGGGSIAWEWHAFDHIVQERFPERANHGSVRAHPELIDLNCDLAEDSAPDAAELAELRATGYVGEEREEDARRPRPPDWLHTNAIAYDPERDVILLSSRNLSEVWVIDHSTSTAEAVGHAGGRFGRGGDLLARWGNPQNHAGDGERQLFHQHDAHWIPAGLPGAGNVLLFDNGPRPEGTFSRVLEFHLALPGDEAATSAEPPWSCVAIDGEPFFSSHLSGAQRLPNGNTLVTVGAHARLVEITADGEVAWEYRHLLRGGELARRGPSNPDETTDPHGTSRVGIFRATRLPPEHPGLAALLGR